MPLRRLINATKSHWTDGLCYLISKGVHFEPEENLLVFSDPRGGSTWITELISLIPRTAVLWEPLLLEHNKVFKDLGFTLRQYIPEHEHWDEAKEAFERLFRGKMLNSRMCRLSPVLTFLSAERLIIKFCRANAMIPWLTRNFAFLYAPIYLVRHPFAVTASQLKHGGWKPGFSRFQIPNSRYPEMYTAHAAFLSTIKTKAEARVAVWCLTNAIPLRHEQNDKRWITVHYENLLLHPEHEIERIFGRWHLEVPPALFDRARQASFTSREGIFQQSVELQLSKWKSFFDRVQLERMMAVLDYFNVRHYGMDAYPHTA